MAMQLGHVHIKTREDPQKVAKFYIDNFGATVKRETPGRGCQLDLHGVQLNVTTINAKQNHEQHVGIEHIAIETDDYAGALANFKKNGAADPRRAVQQRPACLLGCARPTVRRWS